MLTMQWFMGCQDDLSDAYAVRKQVFTDEQGVDPKYDIDGTDKESFLLVAYEEEKVPIATGRLYIHGEDVFIGRVAVLKSFRGKGIGDFIMRLLMQQAAEMGYETQKLSAQQDAKIFYDKLGFVTVGEPYEKAGILHVDMVHNGSIPHLCPCKKGNCQK